MRLRPPEVFPSSCNPRWVSFTALIDFSQRTELARKMEPGAIGRFARWFLGELPITFVKTSSGFSSACRFRSSRCLSSCLKGFSLSA